MRNNAARILLASAAEKTPVFNLQNYAPLGENHFLGIFASTKQAHAFSFDDYRNKVLNTFGGKMTLVANSLFSGPRDSFRGILAPVTESRRFEEDNEKLKEQGFKPLAAGLFEDKSKSIWKLLDAGDSKHLVRVVDEDYDRLLKARRSHMPLYASNEVKQVKPQFGDYAYAFVPELQACDFGIYGRNGSKSFIISRRFNKKFAIDDAQVLEAAAADPSLRDEMSRKWSDAESRRAAFTDYLTFIAMLYGKNSDYYRANEQAIMDSRVA